MEILEMLVIGQKPSQVISVKFLERKIATNRKE